MFCICMELKTQALFLVLLYVQSRADGVIRRNCVKPEINLQVATDTQGRYQVRSCKVMKRENYIKTIIN